MKTTYLAFTSSCWAYDESPQKAKQRLLQILKQNGIKPYKYGLCDVTEIPDSEGIYHEPWKASTESGTKLEVEVKEFNN